MNITRVSTIIAISVLLLVTILPGITLASPVPDTGQTKCYNNTTEIPCPLPGEGFFGQDAEYGPNLHSYTDLGNGLSRTM
jgi:hypothetical protein